MGQGQIKFVAAVLLSVFLGSWCAWFYPYDDLLDRSGTPWGADFTMFYVAGQVVLDGAGERLYDQAEHQRRLQQIFPTLDPQFCLPYRYPPAVAKLLAPLAAWPYAVSYVVFLALSCAAYWMATRLLVPSVGVLRSAPEIGDARRWLWAAAAWPVALETLIGGQASMLALLVAAATYVLLSKQRQALSGAVLALALYKPNVLALVALGCLLRYPRMLLGFVPVAAGLVWLSAAPAGWLGLRSYYEVSSQLALQTWDVATPHWKVHGLAPYFTLLAPNSGRLMCCLFGAAAVVLVTFPLPRVEEERWQPLWFATLISINALFNVYMPIYDLVLLFVGAVLTWDYCRSSQLPFSPRAMQLTLVLFYLGPHLSQGMAKLTGVQWFPWLLVALAAWQVRMLRRGHRTARARSPLSAADAPGRVLPQV